jgi:hypothetical protein
MGSQALTGQARPLNERASLLGMRWLGLGWRRLERHRDYNLPSEVLLAPYVRRIRAPERMPSQAASVISRISTDSEQVTSVMTWVKN